MSFAVTNHIEITEQPVVWQGVFNTTEIATSIRLSEQHVGIIHAQNMTDIAFGMAMN